jgi:ferritin-like metal-binding protein YciE
VADLPAGTDKLVQYLNEAYGLEKRLEVALGAHLGMATRATYKKRLRAHLAETKRHGREVGKRIKQLGGVAETVDLPGPDVVSEAAQTAVAGVQRAAALAQGGLHVLRGTGEEEKQLKNAKTELASEAEEIGTYSAILTLAETLGDRASATLARSILREERRMASFLEAEIPRLTKAVAKAEVPASQRAGGKRRTAKRTKASAAKGAKAVAAKSTKASAAKSTKASAAKSTKASAAKRTKAASKRTKATATKSAKAATKRAKAATKSTRAVSRAKAKPRARTARA